MPSTPALLSLIHLLVCSRSTSTTPGDDGAAALAGNKESVSTSTSSSSSNTHGSVSVQVIQEVIGGSTSDEPNEITEIQFDDGSSVAPLDEASNKRKSWRATQFNANILVEA